MTSHLPSPPLSAPRNPPTLALRRPPPRPAGPPRRSVPCDAVKFVQYAYSVGYRFYDPVERNPSPKSLWSVLQDVEFQSFRDKPTTVAPRTKHIANAEWWLVHADAALPPGWRSAGEG